MSTHDSFTAVLGKQPSGFKSSRLRLLPTLTKETIKVHRLCEQGAPLSGLSEPGKQVPNIRLSFHCPSGCGNAEVKTVATLDRGWSQEANG